MSKIVLYHGTSEASADVLTGAGWKPHSGSSGGQCGNPAYLYLATTPESALWYAQEKGCEAVLAVEVDISRLIVDPDDGTYDTVEEELSGSMAGSLALVGAVEPSAFSRWAPATKPGI